MKLTSALFEAYLKCPTKCYLRSTGQTGSGNAYAEWVREQNDAYRKEAVQRLVTAAGDGVAATTPGAENLKTATWRLAVDLPLETETMASRLHAWFAFPEPRRGGPLIAQGKAAEAATLGTTPSLVNLFSFRSGAEPSARPEGKKKEIILGR